MTPRSSINGTCIPQDMPEAAMLDTTVDIGVPSLLRIQVGCANSGSWDCIFCLVFATGLNFEVASARSVPDCQCVRYQ